MRNLASSPVPCGLPAAHAHRPGRRGQDAAGAGRRGRAGGDGVDVAWVELAPLTDPRVIAPAVAARLRGPDTPGVDPGDPIIVATRGGTPPAGPCRARQLRASRRGRRRPRREPARPVPVAGCPRHQPRAARRRGGALLAGAAAGAPTRPGSSRNGHGWSRRPSPSPTPTGRPSPRYARGSTGCRWRSSWPPPGCACSPSGSSPSGSTTCSACLPGAPGPARPAPGAARHPRLVP